MHWHLANTESAACSANMIMCAAATAAVAVQPQAGVIATKKPWQCDHDKRRVTEPRRVYQGSPAVPNIYTDNNPGTVHKWHIPVTSKLPGGSGPMQRRCHDDVRSSPVTASQLRCWPRPQTHGPVSCTGTVVIQRPDGAARPSWVRLTHSSLTGIYSG